MSADNTAHCTTELSPEASGIRCAGAGLPELNGTPVLTTQQSVDNGGKHSPITMRDDEAHSSSPSSIPPVAPAIETAEQPGAVSELHNNVDIDTRFKGLEERLERRLADFETRVVKTVTGIRQDIGRLTVATQAFTQVIESVNGRLGDLDLGHDLAL